MTTGSQRRLQVKAGQHTTKVHTVPVNAVVEAVIFADAYVRIGEDDYKAGQFPAGTQIPRTARDDNGNS